MAFRNIKFSTPREFRCSHLVELVDKDFKQVNYIVNIPTSCEYSLKDMIAAGVNVHTVDPTVIHDSNATTLVADSVISKSFEPSKKD